MQGWALVRYNRVIIWPTRHLMSDMPNTPAEDPEHSVDRPPRRPDITEPPVVLNPDKPQPQAIKRAIDVIARGAIVDSVLPPDEQRAVSPRTPWLLEQFFAGDIDLDAELAARNPNLPLMSVVKFQKLGSSKRGVAGFAVQDGSAQAIFDVDGPQGVMQMAYTLGAMMTMRFVVYDVSISDRRRWLELMRRPEGGIAFLWGPQRWESDYLICVVKRYFTNLYAFSPHSIEAAIRLTPEVTEKLLNWLEKQWDLPADADDASINPDLLTW